MTGCGYTVDRHETFRVTNAKQQHIQTVSVPVFQSREFRRGLELQLTEALAKKIEAETPFKLAHRDRADTELSGMVLEVRQGTLGRDFENVRPRQTAATVVVSWIWRDLRTGEILAENERFVHTVDYIPPIGEDFYHAMQEVMDRVAERILEEAMYADW